MTPLKPCPFDGGIPELLEAKYLAPGRFYVRCTQCNLQSPGTYANAAEALFAWNRRAADPETVEMVTKCRNFITTAPFGKDQDEDDVLDEIEDWLQAHAEKEAPHEAERADSGNC